MPLFARLILTVDVAVALTGCGAAAVRLVEDAAEAVTARDCSISRAMLGEGALCEPLEIPPEPDPVYCFHTIGQVDCYAVPDAMSDTNERAPRPTKPIGG